MTLPLGRPARVGVVGLGRIYDLVARGYRSNDDLEIVALCDPDPARLAERGAEWPDAQQFTDLDDLLGADLDAVDVLVPTPLHCEVVCKVLRAGLHVNMQKPFANTLAEADEMIATADAAGVYLRVMENFVYYEPLRELKRVVESGEIGEPAGLHMKMVATGNGGWEVPWSAWEWQFKQARSGRGILAFDDGWHKFSVAHWLFGPVVEIMAWIGRTEVVPDLVVIDAPTTIMWTHANGLRGVFDITFAPDMLMKSNYYTNDERFEVTGRKGFARVNRCTSLGIQQPSLEVYHDGELRASHALDDDWGSSFDRQTRDFYRYLVHGGEEPLWTAQQAREVLALNLAAYDSAAANGPVQLSN
ncbi:MAG TPA: Gfo/Idh/MocA family oxidoreductase [Acidimicrobiia bacterium]|nr:Gfo/Idh/MocA family oxidoreductase [Acidimicrobiia bacterium]